MKVKKVTRLNTKHADFLVVTMLGEKPTKVVPRFPKKKAKARMRKGVGL